MNPLTIKLVLNHKLILRRSPSLLLLILVSSVKSQQLLGSDDEKQYKYQYDYHPDNRLLNTTICKDRCMNDCISYLTPIGSCYNGNSTSNEQEQTEIEHSNPFGENDIWDDPIILDGTTHVIGIHRNFYKSTNSSCTGGITDFFDRLPLDKCIGPFGPPRPWGILAIASEGFFARIGGQISL